MATDSFSGGDAGTLGANWTNSAGSSNQFEVFSGTAANAGTATCLEGYTGTAAPADQSSQVTLKALTATSDEGPGPAVRLSTAALTGYFAQCNTTEIKLYKVVATVFTQLGSDAAAAAVNDVIYIEAIGTSITVKKNGTTIIGPIVDAAIATGNWGMWYGTGGAARSQEVDDWVGVAAGGITAAQMVPAFHDGGRSPMIGRRFI